jgi:Membrane proteins related to metalloendopeptidases
MQAFDNQRKTGATKKAGQRAQMLQRIPKIHLAAVAGLTSLLGLFVLLPSKSVQADLAAERRVSQLELPAFSNLTITSELDLGTAPFPLTNNDLTTSTETVKSGDNLSLIFKRVGLRDSDMMELLQSTPEAKRLTALYPGHTLEFAIDADGKLNQLRYIESRLNSYRFNRNDAGFNFEQINRTPDIKLSSRTAEIKTSLFDAGKQAFLDDKLVMELANIFGWDIDFALDIRSGDSFKVLFEEAFLDGEKIGTGNILAAEFNNRSNSYQAVRYVDSNGQAQYYTPTGETMRKEFLRTPIDFARISSHFSLNRKHPVLNTLRAHKGTDYAARHGTPIKATGDGKVVYAGKKGGYGNVVIIQHGQTYRTLYAHISKFRKGIRSGSRVKQGQVIAYVGSTGLATGPHLHYEFYVNGAVRNPVTVKLPKAQSISDKELQQFLQQTQPLLAELSPEQPRQFASSEPQASNTPL